jgi:hypothetical protein
MSERKVLQRSALGILLAIGISACGGAEDDGTTKASSKDIIPHEAEYPGNGSRIIRFTGTTKDSENRFQFPSDILQICDGADLVEISLGSQNYPAGAISRSTLHPACKDGGLTPSDFEVPS